MFTKYSLSLLILFCVLIGHHHFSYAGLRLKVDSVDLINPNLAPGSNGTFTTVNLANTYTNPVVLVMPTTENPDGSTVRIRNVTSNSFDIAVSEPPPTFGGSLGVVASTIHYMVIEAGSYNIGGVLIEAGNAASNPLLLTNTFQGSRAAGTPSLDLLTFSSPFVSAPAVIAQVQSSENEVLYPLVASERYLETVVTTVTAANMEFALERGETSAGLYATEDFGYLAVSANTTGTITDVGSGASFNFESILTTRTVNHNCFNVNYDTTTLGTNPLVVASQNSRFGGDGGWIKRCALTTTQVGFLVDEDQANDAEQNHTTEIVGALLFASAFDAIDATGLKIEAGIVNTPTESVSGSPPPLAFTSVTFPNPFENDNVVVLPMTAGGGGFPTAVRIKNVDRNGFEIAQVQPDGELGSANSFSVDYVAILEGTYIIADNIILEAGSFPISNEISFINGGSTAAFSFANTFPAAPVFLAHIQTVANEPGLDPASISDPWLTVATDNVTATQAFVALERAETTVTGTLVTVPETIGYLAMNASVQQSLLDNDGNFIKYESLITPDIILGPTDGDGCFESSFVTADFATIPLAVASPRLRDGANGFWLVKCFMSSSQIGLFSDEDRSNDTERGHTSESASVLIFENAFESDLLADLEPTKTVTVLNDPVNNATNPKAIQNAALQYTVTIQNTGMSETVDNTIVIEDALPEETELYIGDGITSPFTITNNTDRGAGNTLNFTAFAGFASTTDSFAFSNDNGLTFNYEPQDPDNDNYDPAVTHFRIIPTGNVTGASEDDLGLPYIGEIEISYQVRLK